MLEEIRIWVKINKSDLFFALIVFIVAAVPRLLDLGIFLTADEKNWLGRSFEFIKAFKDFRFNDMLQTTHPGVTTLWLSGITVTFKMIFSHMPFSFKNLPVFIAPAQFAVAMANTVLIPIVYLLLRRMLPGANFVAAIASLFIALDPFIIGYSRVVHVDALLAGLLLAAALSTIIYGQRNFNRRWLVVSAIFSSLAILTKAPAVFSLPYLMLVILVYGWSRRRTPGFIIDRVRDLMIWLLLAAIIFLVVWPAVLFVPDPEGNVLVLKRDLSIAAATPHNMTEEYAINSLFYIYTLLTRTNPATLAFSISFLVIGIWHLILPYTRCIFSDKAWDYANSLISMDSEQAGKTVDQAKNTHHPPFFPNRNRNFAALSNRRVGWLLTAYIFFFVLMMTLGAKKGDRYILPVFPAIDTIAAFGAVQIGKILKHSIKIKNPKSKIQKIILVTIPIITVLYLGVTVYRYHPYAIAYSNPLLPDNLSEERGWGEGLEQVGAWLNEHDPDAAVASWYPEELGVYTRAHVAHINAHEQGKIKYVVLYRNMFGRAPDHYANNFIDEYYKKRLPVFVVKIAGKEFAWVYEKRVYERVIGELLPGAEVSQVLPVKFDNWSGLEVRTATYAGRAKTGELVAAVSDASGQERQKWRVPVSEIIDNGWLRLTLDESVQIPKGGIVKVAISAAGTEPANAPTIRYTQNNDYRATNMVWRGEKRPGDLAVRLIFSVNGELASEEDNKLVNP